MEHGHVGFDNFGEHIYPGDDVKTLKDLGIKNARIYTVERREGDMIVISYEGSETKIDENQIVCI